MTTENLEDTLKRQIDKRISIIKTYKRQGTLTYKDRDDFADNDVEAICGICEKGRINPDPYLQYYFRRLYELNGEELK